MKGLGSGRGRMVPARDRCRPALVARGVLAVLLTIMLAGFSVAAADIDVAVVAIELDVIHDAAALAASIDTDKTVALVGDTVRARAWVRNLGTTRVEETSISFFFLAQQSGEHGKLGDQTVLGLDPGEQRKAVVTISMSEFLPDEYVIIAFADPDSVLGEADADRCNNVFPVSQRFCEIVDDASDVAFGDESLAELVLLDVGTRISELTEQGDEELPLCRLGELDQSFGVKFVNVGTETIPLTLAAIGSVGLQGQVSYRIRGMEGFELLDDDVTIDSKEVAVGELGRASIGGVDYDRLESAIGDSFRVLGRSVPVQLMLTLSPVSSGTGAIGEAQELVLPSRIGFANFYSEIDLWTFPARTACSSTTYSGESARLQPGYAENMVFHAITSAGGTDTLYMLRVHTGTMAFEWPSTQRFVTSPVAAYTGSEYRVWIGREDGSILALRSYFDEDVEAYIVEELASWSPPSSDYVEAPSGDGEMTSYLQLSGDGERLLASSSSGLAMFEATSGQRTYQVSSTGTISDRPVYLETSGHVIYATTSQLYRLNADGNVVGSSSANALQGNVTTPLEVNADESLVFFGTSQSGLYAYDAISMSEVAVTQSQVVTISGLALVQDGDEDAVIFISNEFGQLARVEYSGEFRDRDIQYAATSELPADLVGNPALLPTSNGKDVAAAFVGGLAKDTNTGTVQAWVEGNQDDLDKQDVTIWGSNVPFEFELDDTASTSVVLLELLVVQSNDGAVLLVTSTDGYVYAFSVDELR